MVVTLGIGWFVWALVAFGRGQTPAKQVLNMRVVTLRTGEKSTWGRMFVREIIAKPLVGGISVVTLGIANFWLIWDSRNQELWDKVVATIVVNDPNKQLMPAPQRDAPMLSARRSDDLPFPARALPEPAVPTQTDAEAARLEGSPETE